MNRAEIWALDFRTRFDPAFMKMLERGDALDFDFLAVEWGLCL